MNLEFISKLFEKLRRPLGLFLLLVLTSILQLVLDLNFVCLCQAGPNINYVLHMVLPSLILTFVDRIVNIFYKKKFFLTVDCCTCKCCCSYTGKTTFEFIIVTGLWIAMVLFKGDWYFCVKTSNSIHKELPCKERNKDEDQIKDSYKADSRSIGLGLCCCLLLIWIFAELFRTKCRSLCHQCRRPHFEAKYTKILSDELSSLIEEEFQKIAKEKAKQMLMPKIKVIKDHEIPECSRSPGQVPQSTTSQGEVPQSNTSQGEVPQSNTSQGEVPQSNTSQGEVPQSNTSQGEVPQSNTSQGEVPQSTTSQGEVSQSNTSQGEVPQSNTSQGEVSQSNVSEENFSQAWKDISDPKFIFTFQRASNTTTNTETPHQPGTNQDGLEESRGGDAGILVAGQGEMEMRTFN